MAGRHAAAGWLASDADDPAPNKDKKKRPPVASGPEALAFREETKINFAAGVVTLIPLDRLRVTAPSTPRRKR